MPNREERSSDNTTTAEEQLEETCDVTITCYVTEYIHTYLDSEATYFNMALYSSILSMRSNVS